jgi:hypothetical protein
VARASLTAATIVVPGGTTFRKLKRNADVQRCSPRRVRVSTA